MIDYNAIANQAAPQGLDYNAIANQSPLAPAAPLSPPASQGSPNWFSSLSQPFLQGARLPLGALQYGIGKLFGSQQDVQRGQQLMSNQPVNFGNFGNVNQVGYDANGQPLNLGAQIGQAAGAGLQIGSLVAAPELTGASIPAKLASLGLMGAAQAGGQSLAQGENAGQIAGNTALGAGAGIALGGATEGAGALARWFTGANETGGLPEMLSRQTFKGTPEEFTAQANALANGNVMPKSLARQALNDGLPGDPMAATVKTIQQLNTLEGQLQSTVGNQTITLPNKKGYLDALKDVITHYADNSYGTRPEVMQEAVDLKNQLFGLKSNEVPAQTALELKRFFDGVRTESSFAADAQLAPKQGALKGLADTARQALKSQIPGTADILAQQQKYINYKDALVDYASKNMNKHILGLTDAIVGGGGFATGGPFGAMGAETIMRGFQQPQFRMPFASTLQGVGNAANAFGQAGGSTLLDALRKVAVNRTAAGLSQ